MRSIPLKETLTIEFKSDRKKLPDSDLIDEVVGMSNTDGGVIFLGVEDDGTITGIHKQHADVMGVAALVANKTIPSVSVRAELIEENGFTVLSVSVPRNRSVISTSDGKILRRRLKIDGSPEIVPMYAYEIPRRLSDLSMLDYSAQVLQNAAYEDLDPYERQRLRKIIQMRNGDRSLLELSDEELDKALQLAREDNGVLRPTVTGMLLIGKEEQLAEIIPTAKASFQVLQGTTVRKNEQTCKPMLAMFESFEEYMNAWNPEREMTYGLIRIPIPEFSPAAFREGLVNAFSHRDYTILQGIRVAIDDEGLTISSPGGFIDGVSLHNLLTVEPRSRNSALSDALKRIGLAEITGRGIDRIYEGSIVYGRPWPDYSESTDAYVKLFIQRAKPDLLFAKMIADEEDRTGHSLPINSLLILSALRDNRRLKITELAERINSTEVRTKAAVERLVESGLVEATGNGKARTYILSLKIYKNQENTIGYVRQTGIDSVRYEALILELAEKQGGCVTRENVVDLLKVSPDQAYKLLKAMADKEKLILEGKGRAARYRIV